jgi:arylsulfatase A-like enzyme
MQGSKSDIAEGGIRNWLAVQGPGVPRGVIDSTLTDITDILPTIAELAGIDPAASTHLPWDGISMTNLLLTTKSVSLSDSQAGKSNIGKSAAASSARVRRGTSLANPAQLDRFLVTIHPSCWHANAVPDLDSNR